MYTPISTSPYNDDYNPSKRYVAMLAIPGRVLQAREVTQLQTMTMDFLGRLGSSLYNDGNIISGCILTTNGTTARISSGYIYYNGLIHLMDETSLTIEALGSETIGVKEEISIVDEVIDDSLRDPAQGYKNYGQAGANRLKIQLRYTVNDATATTVFRLEDGKQVVEVNSGENSVLTETLARRTYDENGSYKVRGLELRDKSESSTGTDGKHYVHVMMTAGKAYILGYEVTKNTGVTIQIPWATDTREVLNEPHVYATSTNSYALNNYPVAAINAVSAQVPVTKESVTRGNISGGIDYLRKSPVVKVDKVYTTSPDKTYTAGVDYQLTRDGIDWSLSGEEPAIGTTYYVDYSYNKAMEVDVDFTLTSENGNSYINFVGTDKPVNNSTVQIGYEFYLYRRDLVCLDRFGEITVLAGRSDIYDFVSTPVNNDESLLPIGSVMLYPNSDEVLIVNQQNVRLAQSDLQNMKVRIDDLEYNQAISDLDREAMEGETATQLKGIYTDGFIGTTKCDLSHEEFDCLIDTDLREMTLPVNQYIYAAVPDNTQVDTSAAYIGRVIMAPYNHVLALSQPYVTGRVLVNEFNAFIDTLCPVTITPEVDNWIEESKIVVEEQETKSVTLRRWWYHQGESWVEAEKQKWTALTGSNQAYNNSTMTITDTQVSQDVLFDTAIMYMRDQEINVTGDNFGANTDNIEGYFNDTKVQLTPTGTTEVGSTPGTVKADAKGHFTCKFNVVPNTPCGSVEVRMQSSLHSGTAIYKAEGRQQLIQETVLTTKTTISSYDPAAQSFSFDKDTILTQIGLYFSAKDPERAVVVQIRNMVNGYPGTTVYAETVLQPDEVLVGGIAEQETLVKFNQQPVYCQANEQYCFCIISDSNEYELWLAELGQTDLKTNEPVARQPYNAGVLFLSSNALTWSAEQTKDLTFNLYSAQYTGKGVIIFEEIPTSEISRLVLAANFIDYQNLGVTWYYRLVRTQGWTPFDIYTEHDLQTTTEVVDLKVEINVTESMSPIIAGDCINLVAFMEKQKATYVSRRVQMDEEFTKIKVSVELALPSGTAVQCWTQCDDDTSNQGWVQMTSPEIVAISTEFARYTWERTGVQAKQYRVKLILETDNPLIRPRARKLMSIMNKA